MRILRLFFLVVPISLLAGCTDLFQTQPPAPILGKYPAQYPEASSSKPPEPPVPQTPPVIVTKPLENINKPPEMVEIKPDLPPPQVILPPQQPESSPNDLSAPETDGSMPPESGSNNSETVPPLIDPGSQEPPPVADATPPPPPKAPEAYQPMESIGPQSPAVGSLVMSANENSQSGNYDSASAAIERAIRIEPRNAALYYKLAVLRLNQSKPRLAEDTARKAALLAVNDNNIKKHSWLLIANARELQSNFAGAEKAKAEAAKY